jgi:hypothetical protein
MEVNHPRDRNSDKYQQRGCAQFPTFLQHAAKRRAHVVPWGGTSPAVPSASGGRQTGVSLLLFAATALLEFIREHRASRI